jgi:hypothetical protein
VVPDRSPFEGDLQDIRRLPPRAIKELEKFFEATDALEPKTLKFLGWRGPANASLAFIEGAKPQGEVECALVIQMAMAVLNRLGGGHCCKDRSSEFRLPSTSWPAAYSLGVSSDGPGRPPLFVTNQHRKRSDRVEKSS